MLKCDSKRYKLAFKFSNTSIKVYHWREVLHIRDHRNNSRLFTNFLDPGAIITDFLVTMNTLIVASTDFKIRIIDMESEHIVNSILTEGVATSLTISQCSEYLGCAINQDVNIYSINNNMRFHHLLMKFANRHNSRIIDIKFWETDTGITLVSSSYDKDIKFLAIEDYDESVETLDSNGRTCCLLKVYEICVPHSKMVGIVYETESRIYEEKKNNHASIYDNEPRMYDESQLDDYENNYDEYLTK